MIEEIAQSQSPLSSEFISLMFSVGDYPGFFFFFFFFSFFFFVFISEDPSNFPYLFFQKKIHFHNNRKH